MSKETYSIYDKSVQHYFPDGQVHIHTEIMNDTTFETKNHAYIRNLVSHIITGVSTN